MNQSEFAAEEYKNLRAEISTKMNNQYQILGLGLGGISILLAAAFQLEIYQLFLVLPFLISANAELYMMETTAIVNVGNYLKK